MRILQISRSSPSSAGDGSRATFATLRAVCRAGHHVTYAWFPGRNEAGESPLARRLSAACEGRLVLLPLPGRMNWLDEPHRAAVAAARAARALGTCVVRCLAADRRQAMRTVHRLAGMLRPFDPAATGRLRALLGQNAYDLVQVDNPWTVGVARYLPPRPPKLFVVHEIQTELVGQSFPGDARLPEVVRRAESAQLARYDAVATLSEEDAALLGRWPGLPRVYCSPLGFDASSYLQPAAGLGKGARVRFTFLGGHRHYPNADAVEWLCREIAPRLRVAFPYMKLDVIGRYPARVARRLAGEGVCFLGFRDDPAELLRQSIFLCPVRLGSGMRIKILDAVLRGAAVISTGVGASGLGMVAGTHYLAADTPEEFVAQARQLVEDDHLRQSIALAAQRHVLERFSPEAAARRRIAVLEDVIRRHRWEGSPIERKAA